MKALDQLARLLVLEGAFQGSWSKLPLKRGLRAARQELGDRILPVWTDPQDSGMYSHLLQKIHQGMKFTSLTEAEDVMQNALAGLDLNGHPGKNPFRNAGECFAGRIQNGSITPLTLAKANLGFWLWKKAQNEKKGSRGFRDWSIYPEVANPQRHSDLGELFTEAVLDQEDPVGITVRKMMRNSFPEGSISREHIDCLVDYLEAHSKWPNMLEFARDNFGIRAQGMTRTLKAFKERTAYQVAQDASVQDALELRLLK